MKTSSGSGKSSLSRRHDYEEIRRNLETIDVMIKGISEKYSIPTEEIIKTLSVKPEEELKVPTFIFHDSNLGVLEALTKYLKDQLNLTYHEIAKILNRDDRVVWVTYNKAKYKRKDNFEEKTPSIKIPISIFTDANLGPLESISKFLVDKKSMHYSEAAKLLNRKPRAIWSSYKRAIEK